MTTSFHRRLVLALLALATAACGGAQEGSGTGAGPAPADPGSLAAGVYNEVQATQGQTVFDSYCSGCHSAFDLLSPNFAVVWSGRSLQDLYTKIKDTMPESDPGVLAPEQATSVMAFMLSRQGFPAGEEALPVDPTFLATIQIEPLGGN